MSDKVARLASFAGACFLVLVCVFGYGLAVGYYEIWPFRTLQGAKEAAESYAKYGELVPPNRRHQAAPDAARVPFQVHAPDERAGGHYVFMGWDEGQGSYAAWLHDADGERLHSWTIDYTALDPDGPANGTDDPHPFTLLADGSIIVGFDKGDVMARLDACGAPLWIRPGIFHHAMEPAGDGSVWTWRAEGTAYGHYHYLNRFDVETGETLEEIGLVEDIIAGSEAASYVFGLRPDHPFQTFARDPGEEMDLFHPNDVEELPASLAAQFPMFEAGDLLLSLRNLHLVLVIDRDDHAIKWWSGGPWRYQHDPDFTDAGEISVYSNNPGSGRSEILTIDPATRRVGNDLDDPGFAFYSGARGKHQQLPNGNVLIVVPEQGRVVEVTADGRKVLEFNNISPHGEAYNEDVENAMWLEPGYLDAMPTCGQAVSGGGSSIGPA